MRKPNPDGRLDCKCDFSRMVFAIWLNPRLASGSSAAQRLRANRTEQTPLALRSPPLLTPLISLSHLQQHARLYLTATLAHSGHASTLSSRSAHDSRAAAHSSSRVTANAGAACACEPRNFFDSSFYDRYRR